MRNKLFDTPDAADQLGSTHTLNANATKQKESYNNYQLGAHLIYKSQCMPCASNMQTHTMRTGGDGTHQSYITFGEHELSLLQLAQKKKTRKNHRVYKKDQHQASDDSELKAVQRAPMSMTCRYWSFNIMYAPC